MQCMTTAIPFIGQLSYNARFAGKTAPQPEDVLVVDCTDPLPMHPHIVTHHKGQNVPGEIMGDTSSGSILNALAYDGGRGHPVLHGVTGITTNHFDIDSFVAVWCAGNPRAALAHQAVLRRVAHIGDFRELSAPRVLGGSDGGNDDPTEREALALCCWLNTLERTHFSRPFDEEDVAAEAEAEAEAEGGKASGTLAKFAYFLPRFGAVLQAPLAQREVWSQEYECVLAGLAQLADPSRTQISRWPAAGLVAIETSGEPTHYYALFAATSGFDIVLSVYGGGRVELESKYTTFVDLRSRLVPPRLDLQVKSDAARACSACMAGCAWQWRVVCMAAGHVCACVRACVRACDAAALGRRA
jgi:hypothetical protein